MPLTIKQENFCNYYLECGNASEAYRRAYSCSKMKDESVNSRAYELLKRSEIAARVKHLQKELRDRSDLNKDEAVGILTNIARANVVDMLEIRRTANFRVFLIKDLSKLPVSFQLAIQSVKSTDKGFEVKMYSKIDALDRLSKMMGWDAPEKKDITSNGNPIGQDIKIEVIDKRSQIDEDTDD
ncbi:terminase small subunit [Parabacteroides chongii]|uniref:terminase small subunit n=1 Tax=Parabacteroides chongii TaxID=2685834 RepID=UPI00240D390F|nr:terminase small subunit [Parabacteroides chongii]WFE85003.1 terminase small subunit [Parabacteroides chongii]